MRQRRGPKRFGWSSISHKGSDALRLCLRKIRLLAPKSSFCAGLRMAETPLKKLFGSSGILVHLGPYAKWKNIEQSLLALPSLNWSSIQTSVADPLVPRLGTSVSHDPNIVIGFFSQRTSWLQTIRFWQQRGDRRCAPAMTAKRRRPLFLSIRMVAGHSELTVANTFWLRRPDTYRIDNFCGYRFAAN